MKVNRHIRVLATIALASACANADGLLSEASLQSRSSNLASSAHTSRVILANQYYDNDEDYDGDNDDRGDDGVDDDAEDQYVDVKKTKKPSFVQAPVGDDDFDLPHMPSRLTTSSNVPPKTSVSYHDEDADDYEDDLSTQPASKSSGDDMFSLDARPDDVSSPGTSMASASSKTSRDSQPSSSVDLSVNNMNNPHTSAASLSAATESKPTSDDTLEVLRKWQEFHEAQKRAADDNNSKATTETSLVGKDTTQDSVTKDIVAVSNDEVPAVQTVHTPSDPTATAAIETITTTSFATPVPVDAGITSAAVTTQASASDATTSFSLSTAAPIETTTTTAPAATPAVAPGKVEAHVSVGAPATEKSSDAAKVVSTVGVVDAEVKLKSKDALGATVATESSASEAAVSTEDKAAVVNTKADLVSVDVDTKPSPAVSATGTVTHIASITPDASAIADTGKAAVSAATATTATSATDADVDTAAETRIRSLTLAIERDMADIDAMKAFVDGGNPGPAQRTPPSTTAATASTSSPAASASIGLSADEDVAALSGITGALGGELDMQRLLNAVNAGTGVFDARAGVGRADDEEDREDADSYGRIGPEDEDDDVPNTISTKDKKVPTSSSPLLVSAAKPVSTAAVSASSSKTKFPASAGGDVVESAKTTTTVADEVDASADDEALYSTQFGRTKSTKWVRVAPKRKPAQSSPNGPTQTDEKSSHPAKTSSSSDAVKSGTSEGDTVKAVKVNADAAKTDKAAASSTSSTPASISASTSASRDPLDLLEDIVPGEDAAVLNTFKSSTLSPSSASLPSSESVPSSITATVAAAAPSTVPPASIAVPTLLSGADPDLDINIEAITGIKLPTPPAARLDDPTSTAAGRLGGDSSTYSPSANSRTGTGGSARLGGDSSTYSPLLPSSTAAGRLGGDPSTYSPTSTPSAPTIPTAVGASEDATALAETAQRLEEEILADNLARQALDEETRTAKRTVIGSKKDVVTTTTATAGAGAVGEEQTTITSSSFEPASLAADELDHIVTHTPHSSVTSPSSSAAGQSPAVVTDPRHALRTPPTAADALADHALAPATYTSTAIDIRGGYSHDPRAPVVNKDGDLLDSAGHVVVDASTERKDAPTSTGAGAGAKSAAGQASGSDVKTEGHVPMRPSPFATNKAVVEADKSGSTTRKSEVERTTISSAGNAKTVAGATEIDATASAADKGTDTRSQLAKRGLTPNTPSASTSTSASSASSTGARPRPGKMFGRDSDSSSPVSPARGSAPSDSRDNNKQKAKDVSEQRAATPSSPASSTAGVSTPADGSAPDADRTFGADWLSTGEDSYIGSLSSALPTPERVGLDDLGKTWTDVGSSLNAGLQEGWDYTSQMLKSVAEQYGYGTDAASADSALQGATAATTPTAVSNPAAPELAKPAKTPAPPHSFMALLAASEDADPATLTKRKRMLIALGMFASSLVILCLCVCSMCKCVFKRRGSGSGSGNSYFRGDGSENEDERKSMHASINSSLLHPTMSSHSTAHAHTGAGKKDYDHGYKHHFSFQAEDTETEADGHVPVQGVVVHGQGYSSITKAAEDDFSDFDFSDLEGKEENHSGKHVEMVSLTGNKRSGYATGPHAGTTDSKLSVATNNIKNAMLDDSSAFGSGAGATYAPSVSAGRVFVIDDNAKTTTTAPAPFSLPAFSPSTTPSSVLPSPTVTQAAAPAVTRSVPTSTVIPPRAAVPVVAPTAPAPLAITPTSLVTATTPLPAASAPLVKPIATPAPAPVVRTTTPVLPSLSSSLSTSVPAVSAATSPAAAFTLPTFSSASSHVSVGDAKSSSTPSALRPVSVESTPRPNAHVPIASLPRPINIPNTTVSPVAKPTPNTTVAASLAAQHQPIVSPGAVATGIAHVPVVTPSNASLAIAAQTDTKLSLGDGSSFVPIDSNEFDAFGGWSDGEWSDDGDKKREKYAVKM